MSKTTKIIAALGVVAGLGVAALPAFTYATETVTGDVDLYVEVNPAIAMEITGNNDDNITDADEDGGYGVAGTNGPARAYSPTGATVIDGQSIVGFDLETASKASSSYLALLPNASGNTKSTVKIWTNNASGYDLAVKANTSANMSNGTDSIAAIAETPTVTTAPGWAFKVTTPSGKTNVGAVNHSEETGSEYDYRNDSQMTTEDKHIVTSAGKTSGGDAWDVVYDVATKADQQTGIYSVELTYTATTNN